MCSHSQPCALCHLPLQGGLDAPSPVKGWIFLESSPSSYWFSSRVSGSLTVGGQASENPICSVFSEPCFHVNRLRLEAGDRQNWGQPPYWCHLPLTNWQRTVMQKWSWAGLGTPAGPCSQIYELNQQLLKIQTYYENLKLFRVLQLSC